MLVQVGTLLFLALSTAFVELSTPPLWSPPASAADVQERGGRALDDEGMERHASLLEGVLEEEQEEEEVETDLEAVKTFD